MNTPTLALAHAALPAAAQVYMVGGAVRDALLGRTAHDVDWVVTGITPQVMLDAGFEPVGRDFPVFLHPHTHAEYALARTERKTAPGHTGFVFHTAPDVTLEQDLARRDFTINAMAAPLDWTGAARDVIDPFGGQADLAARVLRHVSAAFSEDPLRVLRGARFAAQLGGFVIAAETLALMQRMVRSGQLAELSPERVWQELSRGLLLPQPQPMLEVLHATGALHAIAPELIVTDQSVAGSALGGQHQPRQKLPIDLSGVLPESLAERWAVVCQYVPTPSAVRSLSQRLRCDAHSAQLAELLVREKASLVALSPQLDAPLASHDSAVLAQTIHALLVRCDAFRRPTRWAQLLRVAQCIGALSPSAAEHLHAAHARAAAVDTAPIAQHISAHTSAQQRRELGARIAAAIAHARCAAIAQSKD